MKIEFIRRKEIDTEKWNACVERSFKPFVYGYAWYLDAICENWDALVLGDYEAVMPLPWKKKWGISYLYQPYFCQQLGIFSAKKNLNYADFIAQIPAAFQLLDIAVQSGPEEFSPSKVRSNYLLDLNRDYAEINKGYNKDCIKNLNALSKINIEYTEATTIAIAIHIYRQTWGDKNKDIQDAHYGMFEKACEAAQKNGHIFLLRAVENGEVLGAAIFLKNAHYLHYVCAAPTATGSKSGIMHGIIDHCIRRHAGQHLLLDFEGSDIPSVAKFYRKFGPANEPYWQIRVNRLPWFLRWMKRA